MYNQKILAALKEAGIEYARTVKNDTSFLFPEDPMQLPLTCGFINKNAETLVDAFIERKSDEDLLFLMFAHGYELDFNTADSNWEKFEKICEKVSGNKDIILRDSMAEKILERVCSARNQW